MRPSPNQPEAKIRFRPIYVLSGVLLAISIGSLTAVTLDRLAAGQPGWLIVLGVGILLGSKAYERLRRAMGIGKVVMINRRLSWFGNWYAWMLSISMGSFTMVKELDHGRSTGLAVLIGVAGVLCMLAIIVFFSRLCPSAQHERSEPITRRS